jgi:hypothetical protein
MYIYFMIFSLVYKSIAFNPYIYKTINPSLLRKSICEDLNNNFTKVSWVKAKEILHNELSNMDIYGDNLHSKNVEHIFPQVYYKDSNKKNIMKSDMHNLLLCSEKLNNYRQHFKFVDPSYLQQLEKSDLSSFNIINSNSHKVNDINELISLKHDVIMVNKKKKLFIPSVKSRGSISRSLAYFSTKYNFTQELPNVIDINTMIKWNQDYQVDVNEYHKNIIIYKYHNILNPFIIYPDLINYCFNDIATINVEDLYSNNDNMHTTNYLINQIKEKEYLIEKILKAIKK